MEYFDKVFKHFERDGRIHASFKIDDKIYQYSLKEQNTPTS